jgi:hypothetical protein
MLDNPQIIALDFAIAEPGIVISDWQEGLSGMECVAAQLQFTCGGGGTTVSTYLQGSLDLGSNAYDISVVRFGTASRLVLFQVTRQTIGVSQPNDGGFESESIVAPLLGDRLRLKLAVAGTYAATTLSARILAT